MEIADFKIALEDLGIEFRESGQSIVLKHCPECGSSKYKVHLRANLENGMLFGRCYAGSCQTNYSSIKYLLKSGISYSEAMKIHGFDAEESLKQMAPIPRLDVVPAEKVAEDKEEVPDISIFFPLKLMKGHPAYDYAIKRGVSLEMADVRIDHKECAVVFLVKENDTVVGFQKRFVVPDKEYIKAKSSNGFSKSKHILTFLNPGKDILVCEGPFDAVAAWRFGFTGVCTFGASVSEVQISKIIQLSVDNRVNIGLAFDQDEAGLKGASRIKSALFWMDKPCYEMVPSTGKDVNDAWVSGGSLIKKEEKIQYNPAIPTITLF